MSWGDNKNSGPWGGGRRPPPVSGGGGGEQHSLDEIIRKSKEKLSGLFGKGNNNKTTLIVVLVFALIFWLGSGVYTVGTNEQSIVLRFGAYHRTTGPGLNIRLPFPIERNINVAVTDVRRIQVGVTSSESSRFFGRNEGATKIPQESLMLTGDENIIDIDFEVQWDIKEADNYLFNVRDPEFTVKSVAESAMREVISRTAIAAALTSGRAAVLKNTKDIIQETLDYYKTGINITNVQFLDVQVPGPVVDAFRDVQTANADREKMINQAEEFRNDLLPRAEGEVKKIIQEAEAYKKQVLAQAEGDAERFLSVYNKYKDAKDVTRERIYLETMENILRGTDKVVVDSGSGTGVVPYLPLPELKKRNKNN